jgi:hypothetical protein
MRVGFDIDGRLLLLEEKFARAADAEAIVGRFGCAADLNRILVYDVLVGLGVTADVSMSQPSALNIGSTNSLRSWPRCIGLIYRASPCCSKRSTRSAIGGGAGMCARK